MWNDPELITKTINIGYWTTCAITIKKKGLYDIAKIYKIKGRSKMSGWQLFMSNRQHYLMSKYLRMWKNKNREKWSNWLDTYKDIDSPYANLYHRMIICEFGDESVQASREGIGMSDPMYRDWINQ